jgi:hypothetical protein
VVLTDGLFGKEAKVGSAEETSLEKWEKPYSEVCGSYVNAQMSIAIIHATHLCVHESQIPTRSNTLLLSNLLCVE